MAQSAVLVAALKQQLKARGKTYADVARFLGLSEASVKRLFASGQFTLERLDKILEMLEMDIGDLVEAVHRDRRQMECLTSEQEAQIAGDLALLLVAVSVINGFTFSDLLEQYKLDQHQLVQKLAQLDRLKMIDLQPGNRIKLRIAPNFRWLANGPIQRFFLEKVERDFFDSRFDRDTEKLLVFNCLCSSHTNREIQQRMESFVHDISALVKKDRLLPLQQRHGNTLVLALRQWHAALFRDYLRR
jgi:DNA-binding Xre family transcriptional regulator